MVVVENVDFRGENVAVGGLEEGTCWIVELDDGGTAGWDGIGLGYGDVKIWVVWIVRIVSIVEKTRGGGVVVGGAKGVGCLKVGDVELGRAPTSITIRTLKGG